MITDIRMPPSHHMEGIDAARTIHREHPGVGVVVLSQHGLTPRELDVLREMAKGRTNAGIEAALHLSSSIVEKHVSSIFDKLGLGAEPVHRRVAAVLAFLQHA